MLNTNEILNVVGGLLCVQQINDFDKASARLYAHRQNCIARGLIESQSSSYDYDCSWCPGLSEKAGAYDKSFQEALDCLKIVSKITSPSSSNIVKII